jgi:hypothetical protein
MISSEKGKTGDNCDKNEKPPINTKQHETGVNYLVFLRVLSWFSVFSIPQLVMSSVVKARSALKETAPLVTGMLC